jgi:hypothetical protein
MTSQDAVLWGSGRFSSLWNGGGAGSLLLVNSVTAPAGRGGVAIDLLGNMMVYASAVENATGATDPWPYILTCNGTPSGTPSRAQTGAAAIAVDRSAAKLWAYYGGAWNSLSGAGAADLQTVYAAGNTIAATAARSIAFSNAVDATDLLTLTRTFAGAGSALNISMGAGATGVGIDITTANGPGLQINNTSSVAFSSGIVMSFGAASDASAKGLVISTTAGGATQGI